LKNTHHQRLKIISLLILFGATVFFSYHFAKNKNRYQPDRKKQSDVSIPRPKKEKLFSGENGALENTRKKNRPALQGPWDHSSGPFHNSQTEHNKISDSDYPPLEINLADIAYYDPLQNAYVLKKSDLFTTNEEVTGDLLSALKILNKKNMPSDYFSSPEYESAYNEISNFYPDTYIWPYFTNMPAKRNFFLFLFTRYSADNKTWRAYEEDVSDCSQFSQRIYLLLYPGELSVEDEKYFHFLFSNRKNREERKKLCNKIPNIFYTIVTPYILKKTAHEHPASSHAMISFAPDNNLEKLILGEPQSGAFESIEENIRNIMDIQLTQYALMCRMGKIVSITKDKPHEAKLNLAGGYLLPKDPLNGQGGYGGVGDPRWDYGDRPIFLKAKTYGICGLISSYIEQVLNYQSANRWGFLRSVENITRYGDISVPEMEGAVKSSVDVIMHALMDLNNSDLRRVRDEIKDLKNLVDEQSGLSPHIKKSVSELNYLFPLKLKPFLE